MLSVITDWTNDVPLSDHCKYIHKKSISSEINYNLCLYHQTFPEVILSEFYFHPKLHLIPFLLIHTDRKNKQFF